MGAVIVEAVLKVVRPMPSRAGPLILLNLGNPVSTFSDVSIIAITWRKKLPESGFAECVSMFAPLAKRKNQPKSKNPYCAPPWNRVGNLYGSVVEHLLTSDAGSDNDPAF
jgi:hypothetical protein